MVRPPFVFSSLACATAATVLACAGSTPAPKPAAGSAVQTTQGSVVSTGVAKVGEQAPDFELTDIDGKLVKLSSYRGKVVVLEWFNPQCPFVKLSHTKGSLITMAKEAQAKGIVWLAINSGAPGKQGHGLLANREGKKIFNLENPILLDETGNVGKMYGATNTPHMMVVDAEGKLAYRGAIDNSPDGERESPTGGKLVNYVDQAVSELAQHKPVSVPETKAYGCHVKYDSP